MSYAGYPSAAVVLQQPRQPDRSEEPQLQPVDGWDLTAETVDALSELDEGSRGSSRITTTSDGVVASCRRAHARWCALRPTC